MNTASVEVQGTVRPDGTLELNEKLNLPPGQVKVRVETVPASEIPAGRQRPASLQPDESVFHALAKEWKATRGHTSSAARMARNPAYQQIVALGERAVPLILEELRKEPDHWFLALHAITGADPVPPESRGKVVEMAKAWLGWGKDRHYVT